MDRQRVLRLPDIRINDSFVQVVKKLSFSIIEAITISCSFEELRTTVAGNGIRQIVEHLAVNVDNRATVHALLTLKWHFSSLDPTIDDRGLSATRAKACEIVAWRFLARLSERDVVDFCLYELPHSDSKPNSPVNSGGCFSDEDHGDEETSTLLPPFRPKLRPTGPSRKVSRAGSQKQAIINSASSLGMYLLEDANDEEEDPTTSFSGLNALEIAAVADAKQFLSQRTVQQVINGIWCGDITFWGSLSVNTQKKPQFYNKKKADPYSRLRVPKYIKFFEASFFLVLLALYYAVLAERNPAKVTSLGILLYVWIAAFAYDELSEFWDAGSLFYAVDFWNAWDLCIIVVGAASFVARVIGLVKQNDDIIDTAFDILSLEALFLVPRIFSLLSLHPYFGILIPCLKQMTKDFVKFMGVVGILYIGFLTTFIMLARDQFKPSEMGWILIKVFFGSSYLGFDVMDTISPVLGPPLMIIFVCMTNILLLTSLVSILSNSFASVTGRAREEYLFVYSVYVLEASTSNRLTHFYPPLNLIPLLLLRPLRLFLSSTKLRALRIMLLKITHTPIVCLIWLLETIYDRVYGGRLASKFATIGPRPSSAGPVKKQRPFLVDGNSTHAQMQSPLSPEDPSTPVRYDIQTIMSRKEGKRSRGQSQSTNRREGVLEAKFDELTAQVAQLTALILAQQERTMTAREDD